MLAMTTPGISKEKREMKIAYPFMAI